MARKLVHDYTFIPASRQVTLNYIYKPERLLMIVNATDNITIYQFNSPTLNYTNISYNYTAETTTIILSYDTTSMSSTDKLQIWMEEDSVSFQPDETFVDPVSKIRVSTPENLIDTDFEYGLQSQKWETLEQVKNIPTFFSRSGDVGYQILAVNTLVNSDIVTVELSENHNLAKGTPVIVIGSKSVTCDGGFVATNILSNTKFQYKSKAIQNISASILDQYTQIFPGSVYQGTEFDLSGIEAITTDGAASSTLTVNTAFPTNFSTGTSFYLTNSIASVSSPFEADDIITRGYETSVLATSNTNSFTVNNFALKSVQPYYFTGLTTEYFNNSTIGINLSDNVLEIGSDLTFEDGWYTYIVGVGNTAISGLTDKTVYYVEQAEAVTSYDNFESGGLDGSKWLISTGVSVTNQGTGTGSDINFGPNGDSSRYAIFYSGTGTRQLISTDIDMSDYISVSLDYITGNDSNGGSTPATNERLNVRVFHPEVGTQTIYNSTVNVNTWSNLTLTIPVNFRIPGSRIEFVQFNTDGTSFDEIAIDNIRFLRNNETRLRFEQLDGTTVTLGATGTDGGVIRSALIKTERCFDTVGGELLFTADDSAISRNINIPVGTPVAFLNTSPGFGLTTMPNLQTSTSGVYYVVSSSINKISVSVTPGGGSIAIPNLQEAFVVPLTALNDANSILFPSHGLSNNVLGGFQTTNGASAPLTDGNYVIEVVNNDKLRFKNTTNGQVVNLTAAGVADSVFQLTVDQDNLDVDSIFLESNNFNDGQELTYNDNGNKSIPGLVDGGTYYVFQKTTDRIKLAETSAGWSTATLTFAQTFPNNLGISNSMQFYIPNHGLGDGDRVQYLSSTPATGLTNGAWYYVNRISNDRIRLYREREDALTGSVNFISVAQPITGTGSVRRADLVDMATRNDSTSRVLLGTYSVENLSLTSGNSSLSNDQFGLSYSIIGQSIFSAGTTTDSTAYLTETLETLGDDWLVHTSVASGQARFKTVLRDDNYVYVIGTHQERTTTRYDWSIIAYDHDGARQWMRTGHASTYDFAVTGATFTSADNIAICGNFLSGATRYPAVVNFTISTRTFGNTVYSGLTNGGFTGIAALSNGNVWLSGTINDNLPIFLQASPTNINNNVMRGNSNGTVTDMQLGTKVARDSSNNGFWMYYTTSDGYGSTSLQIYKVNTSYSQLWVRTIGGVNAERPYGIDVDSNDDVYISGFTASQGNGSNDMFVAKLSGSTGTILWQKVIGSPSSDIAYAAKLRNDQTLALAGISDSTIDETATIYDDFETGTFSSSIWDVTNNVTIRTPGTGLSTGGFNNSDKPYVNDGVLTVAVQSDDKILIGGVFNSLNSISQNRIARLNSDGTKDAGFTIGGGFNGIVYAIAVQSDGKILVGGGFSVFNGVSVNRIMRLNSDGTADTTFRTNIGTGTNFGNVEGFSQQSDGKIIVTGNFTAFNGITQNYITRLNSNGTIDSTFANNIGTGFNNVAYRSAVQPDGKILVVGFFTTFNGTSQNRITRLESDGTIDSTFATNIGSGFNNSVFYIALQSDGKILVGGSFTTFNGGNNDRIMRLNSDGTADTTFRTNIGTGFNNSATGIQLQSDGKIIVTGNFTAFNGITQNYITRLNTDGTRDTGFSIGTGFNNQTQALGIQSDDKIVAGGYFTTFNNTSKTRIARLNANGSADNLGVSTRHVEFDVAFSRELRTDPIDLTNVTSFSFKYILGSSGNGGSFNFYTLTVQASVNDGGYSTLANFSNSTSEWQTATVNLSSVYRTNNVRLRFAQSANGTNQSEIGLDELIFFGNSVGSSSGALIELDTNNGNIKFSWRLESVSDPIIFYDVATETQEYFVVGSAGDEFVLLNLDSLILGGTHQIETVGVGASDGVYIITGVTDLDTFTMSSTNQINNRSILVDGLTEVDLSRNALNSDDHYFKTGSQVIYTASGAALGNLTSGDTYYVIAFSKDWFKLATSFANAEDGLDIPITSHSAGVHTFTTSSVSGEVIGSGTVTIASGGTVLTGVGTLFSSQFSPGDNIKLYQPATTATKTIASVNTGTDTITVTAHGMSDGDPIYFTQDVYDLTANWIYYINTSATGTPANQFTVHASYSDAITGLSKLNLDGATYSAADIIEHIDSIGTVTDAVIQYVNGQTEIVLRDAVSEAFTDANYAIGTSLLVRADGFALHRPYDGGVELIPSGNPDGQMIRQTRKYFRYQSGKGIQVSMAINFSPTVQPESITRPSSGSTNVATVTTRYPHRLTAGRSITITGATVTSGGNFWNGTFTVSTVVDDYNFTVAMGGTPSQLSAGGLIEYYVNGWTNSRIKTGLFDDQNGLFFEYNGQNLYAVRRSSVLQISGYSSVTFKSGAVIGSGTKFSTQLAVNDKIVIKGQTYVITNITNDSEMYIMPTYRGTDNDRVIITKVVDTKIAQSSWNLDTCNGTGATGFFLDIHKIQMAYIDYSWYGAGKARFGFKDQRGKVIYCHEFIHNNKQTEAYMRSGNLPARYEIENVGSPTYVPSLAHWGTSVIMDGRFDDDRAYVFTASSNNLSVTGAATLAITGRIETVSTYQVFSNGAYRTAGYGLLIPTSSAVFNNITSGITITGANLAASTRTRNPFTGLITPFQPYQASVLSRFGGSPATQATRNILLLDRMPTGTSVGTSSYTVTLATGATPVVYEQPLMSIRLAPSVDTGTPGSLGSREIINRMQLILNSVGILTTHSVEITLRLNGTTNNNDWQRVANPSLSQLVYHTTDDRISNGAIIYSFRSQGSTGTSNRAQALTNADLGEVATLGNSILGGDGVFPDGPDVLTVVAKLVEDPSTVSTSNPWIISGRISWSESQA